MAPADSPTGPLAGLELMHVGATVHDLGSAMHRHSALGVGPWAVADPIDFTSYDGGRDAVVPQRLQIAFGRLPGGVAIELVQPMSDDGPQGRLLASRPGINHLAYWAPDLPRTGRALLDIGATIYAASSGAAGAWDRGGRPGGVAGLLDVVPTVTVALPDGLLVEILSPSMWGPTGLESFFGPAICAVIDPPSAAVTVDQ